MGIISHVYREYIVKLCGASRDLTGKVKQHHVELEILWNDSTKSMVDAITEKVFNFYSSFSYSRKNILP